jgi:type VI secretion system protein VasD
MKPSSVVACILFLLLSGCSSAPLHVQFKSTHYINPDVNNHALPVEIIVYELRDDQAFRQATFEELWKDDRNVLGDSILDRREINLAPGAQRKITLSLHQQTAYIGAIAIFRQPSGGHWRAVKRLGHGLPLLGHHITIVVKGDRINLY